MAVYRNISMNFWKDTKIVDEFSPEDKYFMLYCLTNSYTNLCGCYEISIKQMMRDTGYNEETICKLLNRLSTNYNVIEYDNQNKELLIVNWHKYNWTKSDKLDKPLLEEIKNIKTPYFKEKLSEIYNKRDTVSIPYIYPSDTTVSVSVSVTDNKLITYKENNNYISIVEQIIEFMNELAGTSFKSSTKKTQSLIKARLAEGFTIEDFKDVINYKYYEWYRKPITFSNGVKSDKYYRPNTLFSTKFEEYLEQYKKEYKEHCDRY